MKDKKCDKCNNVAWYIGKDEYLCRDCYVDECFRLQEVSLENLKTENEKLKRELHQQKFNNEHNLSIDQQVSDELKRLRDLMQALVDDIETPYRLGLTTRMLNPNWISFNNAKQALATTSSKKQVVNKGVRND